MENIKPICLWTNGIYLGYRLANLYFAPEFYARHYKLSHDLAGVLLASDFDALQDLYFGRILACQVLSSTKFILLAVVGALVGLFFLYANPQFNTLCWFCLTVFFTRSGFCVLYIIYLAYGAGWQVDLKLRTAVTAWRELLGLCGLIVISALMGHNQLTLVSGWSCLGYP